ncbi:MAG TPA: hypothetical protein VJ873_05520 [bacterium]|nr:hypothetical protein [bacterium]
MEKNLEPIPQALKVHLAESTVKGLYYQAYFLLVERVGREAEGLLGRGLTGREILFIAARVEDYLKANVFQTPVR